MTHLDGLCDHDILESGYCEPCAEEKCIHHGEHPKGACPICAGLDVYAPALYNEPKAWDENGKVDNEGMMKFWMDKYFESERQNKILRDDNSRLLQMLASTELSE